jgi:hypothetical protein
MTAQPAPEPPIKRGRGRPPKGGYKTPIRLDPDVRADLERAVAQGLAASISEEVNRRCRATARWSVPGPPGPDDDR